MIIIIIIVCLCCDAVDWFGDGSVWFVVPRFTRRTRLSDAVYQRYSWHVNGGRRCAVTGRRNRTYTHLGTRNCRPHPQQVAVYLHCTYIASAHSVQNMPPTAFINRRAHSFAATDAEVGPMKWPPNWPPSLQIPEPPLSAAITSVSRSRESYSKVKYTIYLCPGDYMQKSADIREYCWVLIPLVWQFRVVGWEWDGPDMWNMKLTVAWSNVVGYNDGSIGRIRQRGRPS